MSGITRIPLIRELTRSSRVYLTLRRRLRNQPQAGAGDVAGEALAGGVSQVAAIEARSVFSVQGQILLEALSNTALAGSGEPPKPPGAYVEDRFTWLHELVDRPEGQPSQLDELVGVLTEVYRELNKMAFSGVSADGGNGAALLQFYQVASRIDGPVQRWASQITSGSSDIQSTGTRASINARWQSTVLPVCEQALDNRYPFNRRSKSDVGLQDFTTLFAPGGLIDQFFNENLQKHVDKRTRPWTWKRVNNVDLGISAAVLQQMQYADEIRAAFFANGPNPAVQFQITPEALDPKAKSVLLEIDGQKVEYSHRSGAPVPSAVTWPGAIGQARVTLLKKKKGLENIMTRDGSWGWFRLLDAAQVRRTNTSDRKRVIFNIGGRVAIFQLLSKSSTNAFALPALDKFRCPKSM